jgi:SAM-dependent methyltransferase
VNAQVQEVNPRGNLYDVLACPDCQGQLAPADQQVRCQSCSAAFSLLGSGVPAFMQNAPEGMQFTSKKDRSVGSAWRQANNAFYKKVSEGTPSGNVVLDIGAGHGYLRQYFGTNYWSTDVYPYEGLDFLCDLAEFTPLRQGALDLVLLNNVMEHLHQPERVLKSIAHGLRRGGSVAIAVPFIIKVHQAPYDFFRYTHFMLHKLLTSEGFENIRVEAVYTPQSLHRAFFNEMVNALPREALWQKLVAKSCQFLAWNSLRVAERLLRPASFRLERLTDAQSARMNPWVAGYHVLATRK